MAILLTIKKSSIRQYQARLSSFRFYEEKLRTPITGLDLEYKIREIANICGADGGMLFGHDAGAFESHLGPRERVFIYQKLHSIVEAKKWKGIDWSEVFNDSFF
mgnify:FL=1